MRARARSRGQRVRLTQQVGHVVEIVRHDRGRTACGLRDVAHGEGRAPVIGEQLGGDVGDHPSAFVVIDLSRHCSPTCVLPLLSLAHLAHYNVRYTTVVAQH